MTSGRIARWMLMIQEYDLEISHIAGTRNHFADALSRNPAGLSRDHIDARSCPREIMVSAIDLGVEGRSTGTYEAYRHCRSRTGDCARFAAK
jgi:hypothetical protein